MRTQFDICRIVTSSILTWCAFFCSASALSAQTVSDPVFGLSVTPPAGYGAQLLTPMPSQTAIIAVIRSQSDNAGCLIEFKNDDANGALSQAYFNTRANKSEWIEQVRMDVSARYDIHTIDAIEHDGIRGTAIAGDRYYKRPVNVTRMPKMTREWFVILDTMKGRTTIECTAPRLEFEERQSEFEAMLRTISVPK